MSCRSSHVIKLKLSSQLIGQFGHVTASASCKQPEKHGTAIAVAVVNASCKHTPDAVSNRHSLLVKWMAFALCACISVRS